MYPKFIKRYSKHVDLISIIICHWNRSAFIKKKIHVYGHQDETNRPLSTILERLNCDMDALLTKEIAQHRIKSDNSNPKQITTQGLGHGNLSRKIDCIPHPKIVIVPHPSTRVYVNTGHI